MTEFQKRFVSRRRDCPNGIANTTTLAHLLKTSRVAVASSGRALERAGLVCSFRKDGEHAVLKWGSVDKVPNAELTGRGTGPND